jgi:hypothetical protein
MGTCSLPYLNGKKKKKTRFLLVCTIYIQIHHLQYCSRCEGNYGDDISIYGHMRYSRRVNFPWQPIFCWIQIFFEQLFIPLLGGVKSMQITEEYSSKFCKPWIVFRVLWQKLMIQNVFKIQFWIQMSDMTHVLGSLQGDRWSHLSYKTIWRSFYVGVWNGHSQWGCIFSLSEWSPVGYPPFTYYWTVPLILNHSYLLGKLTSSKIADTKVSGF